MTALLWSLTALNLLLAAGLIVGLRRLRSRLRALAVPETLPADPAEPALREMARAASPLLVIRILNPVELALQKHWAAGALGRLTPGLLRQIVAREAARIASQELARHGAQADIRVVDGD